MFKGTVMQRIKPRVGILAITVLMLSGLNAVNAQCTLPYTLSNGQPPDATKVMANFNALIGCLNVGGSSNAIQYNAGSGSLAGLGPLTNGQIVIGSTGNPPQAQTLAAGSGITITNTPGKVTVAATAGSASTGLYRQVMSALPTAAGIGPMNWLNQGTATFSEGPAGMSISASPGADALVLRYVSAPPPPYTLTTLIGATRNSSGFSEVGIGWFDGTARLHVFSSVISSAGAPGILQVSKWSAFNSRFGYDFQSPNSGFSQPIWLQLKDDGTNVSFTFSQDGANFLPLFTVAKSSAYLGPNGYNNLILFVDPRGGQTIGTAMSWTIN
jgi:hypothetical protein